VASSGLSGLSVGVITVGGLLVYAGIRGVTPLQALRDVSSGKPPTIPNQGASVDSGGNVAQLGQGTVGTITAGARMFAADKYSQARRTEPGYSDCSSFVDKAYHAAGIELPDGRMKWPNTTAFATAPAWRTINASETKPGDIALAISPTGHNHMVLITAAGAAEAIGQQNPLTNVKTGTIPQLFANVGGDIVYRTYIGSVTGRPMLGPFLDASKGR